MSRQTLLDKIWEEEKRRFNHPALKAPKLGESLIGTAMLDFSARQVTITDEYIDALTKHMDEERCVRAVLRHEIGHWVYFPHSLATQLWLLAEGERWFGEKTTSIYGSYAELANEGALLHHGLAGDEILKLRGAMSKILDLRAAAKKKLDLEAAVEKGLDPETVTSKKHKNDPCLNRLLLAMYAHTFDGEQPALTEKETGIIEQIKTVPFIDLSLNEHLASFYRFGKALVEHIQDEKHDTNLDDVSNDDICRALSDILRNQGLRAFQTAKKYAQKVRPDFKDPFEVKGKRAGTALGQFQLFDEYIPTFKRWSSSYGLYPTKRPVETDASALHLSGTKEYEIGDPLGKINIFASKGIIGLPFVTRTNLEEEETIPSIEWRVADLLVGIDSSGSMEHPSKGAVQIIAAYIIGRNYHANGAKVGGWNFSTDIAYLSPSRDIDAFYSIMTAYWGGGTTPDFEKLKRFLGKEHAKGIQFRDDPLDLIPDERKKEFIKKSLHVDMKKVDDKLEKLDNVLITDGHLGNPEEVLDHLNQIGRVTRNFIFITDQNGYEAWKDINIPNTWIYLAQKPEDLLRLAIGKSKTLQ